MQDILRQKAQRKLVGGYLFYCPDTLTLDEILLVCAKQILCDGGGDDNCPTCQKIQCGSHPDVCVYPKGDAFSTDDSQGVILDANKKAIMGEYKIIMIKNLENSSEQSQNKLLKVLESPPINTIFLISTTNLNKVLSTVKSRLLKVEIPPFDEDTLTQIFSEYQSQQDFSLALDYSNGYIGETKQILLDQDFMTNYNLAKNIVTKLKSSSQIVDYIVPKMTKSQFLGTVGLMQNMYRDIALIKSKNSNLVKNKTLIGIFESISDEFSMKAIVEIIKRINDVNKKQYSNVTLSLLFESLLTSILEVKYLCA